MKISILNIIFVIFVTVNLTPTVFADTRKGHVSRVTDGDTLSLDINGTIIKVRLAFIDCPEKDQKHGDTAKHYLADKVSNKSVDVHKIGYDRYKRLIGEVFYQGENINLELISKGYCIVYRRYAKGKENYFEAEEEAKRLKLGVHGDPEFVKPWIFRKQRK